MVLTVAVEVVGATEGAATMVVDEDERTADEDGRAADEDEGTAGGAEDTATADVDLEEDTGSAKEGWMSAQRVEEDD